MLRLLGPPFSNLTCSASTEGMFSVSEFGGSHDVLVFWSKWQWEVVISLVLFMVCCESGLCSPPNTSPWRRDVSKTNFYIGQRPNYKNTNDGRDGAMSNFVFWLVHVTPSPYRRPYGRPYGRPHSPRVVFWMSGYLSQTLVDDVVSGLTKDAATIKSLWGPSGAFQWLPLNSARLGSYRNRYGLPVRSQ